MGLNLQNMTAASNPGAVEGPALNPFSPNSAVGICDDFIPGAIRCPARGATLLTAPSMSGALEVMSPRLAESWGQPRLFLRAGAGVMFSSRLKPAQEGGFDPLGAPDIGIFQEISILGQGSEGFMELQKLMVSAGVGVAFSVDTPWRKIRIKPSFEYLRQTLDGWGELHRGVTVCGPGSGPLCSQTLLTQALFAEEVRLISLAAPKTSMDMNGIGPGIEVDTDAGRLGPFMTTVFAGASAYYFLGDLDFQAVGVNEYGETATFDFEANRWAYRIQAGLRFRWQPE